MRRYLSLGFAAVTPRTWETKLAAGTIAGGLLWGVAAIFLFPENSIPHQYMLALFLVGISCGGAAFYWPSKTVYIPTILVELVPISGRFFFIADETAIVTGIVILLFCVMVLRMARYLNLSETESLKLRLEKEELANSLKESRDELEKRVEERTAELSEVNDELRHEICERMRTEKSLSKSEEKYRLLVENAQEAIFVAQDGQLKLVNRATIELSGHTELELLSKPLFEFVYSDDRELVYQNHMKRIAGDKFPQRYTCRILRSNGSVSWAEINSVSIQWEERPGSLVFMTDVTAKREADEALQKSEERYRTFFDTCRDGVFMTNPDGVFIDANDSAIKMLGYDRWERHNLKSLPASGFFVNPEERDTHAALVEKLGVVKDYQTQLRKKDGTIIDVLLTTVAAGNS